MSTQARPALFIGRRSPAAATLPRWGDMVVKHEE